MTWTSLELKKPLYEWRVLPKTPEGRSNGSDLFLADHIVAWLVSHGMTYDTYTQHEKRTLKHSEGEQTYLIFYLEIEDPTHAMLFKLTWL